MLTQQDMLNALEERHSSAKQRKLSRARVAVAGLGGLGSHVAFMLARIGVGHLHLIDFDRVDLANLNRQQYFIRHIGRKKAEALLEELKEINPYLDICAECVRVTEENLERLFALDEVICEAFDRPEQKAMLVNGILEKYPDKLLVAASGMGGYGLSNAIQTRRVADKFYLCGDGVSGIEEGNCLMAPRVALCAAHQANLITEYLLADHHMEEEKSNGSK